MGKIAAFFLTALLTALSLAASLFISFAVYAVYTNYKVGGGLPSISAGKTNYDNLQVYNANPEDKWAIVHAFEQIEYPLEDFQVQVVVVEGLQGADGMFDPLTRKIYLQKDTDYSHTLAHEVGHLIEVSGTDKKTQQLYAQLRDLPADAEWGGKYRKDSDWRSKASEDFAEVFASLFVTSNTPGEIATYYGVVDNEPELRQFYLSLSD